MLARRWDPAWLALLLTVLARALVALSRIDEIEIDRYSGTFAWALLQGMPLDPEQLPVIPHSRGSVIVGLLLVPLVAVLGPTYWTVKLLAIALSGLTAFVLARLAQRCAGDVAAWTVAVLYALVPPSFQMVDVIALGSHGDSILCVALAAYLVLNPERERLRRARFVLLFGLVCGIGYFVSLQFLLALPALLVAWLVRDRASLLHPRALLALVPFAALAWLASVVTTSAQIVNRSLGERVLRFGVAQHAEKLVDTLTHDLRRSWLFEEHGGALFSWLWAAAILAGLVLCLRELRRRPALVSFCLLYPLAALGAYVLTDFQLNLRSTADGMGSRYTMPVTAALVTWVAIGAQRLARERRPAFAALLVAVPALAGARSLVALLDPGYAFRQPDTSCVDLATFHGHVEHASDGSFPARLEWVQRVDADWRAFQPLRYDVAFVPPGAGAGEVADDLALALQLEPPLRWHALVALGFRHGDAWADEEGESERQLERAAATLSGEDLGWLARGVGRSWTLALFEKVAFKSKRVASPGSVDFSTVVAAPVAARLALVEGMGFQAGLRLTPYEPYPLLALERAERLPKPLHRSFFEALGWGYRMRFCEQGYVAPELGALRIERWLPPLAQRHFHAGLRTSADALRRALAERLGELTAR